MQQKERSTEIDIVRGLGICLVVMLHVSLPSVFLTDYFGSFHMAVFIFCSGFCFKEGSVQSNPGRAIRRKISALYVPYVLLNGIMVLLNNLFVYLNIYTDNELFIQAELGIANFFGLKSKIGFF